MERRVNVSSSYNQYGIESSQLQSLHQQSISAATQLIDPDRTTNSFMKAECRRRVSFSSRYNTFSSENERRIERNCDQLVEQISNVGK